VLATTLGELLGFAVPSLIALLALFIITGLKLNNGDVYLFVALAWAIGLIPQS